MSRTQEANRLMTQARVHLPGALDQSIKNEFFHVANEFFTETNIWYEDLPINVDPALGDIASGNQIYQVVPTSGQITRLMSLRDSKMRSRAGIMPELGVVTLTEMPGGQETWTARCALTVTDPLDKTDGLPVFPDWLFSKYNTDFLNGILGRMHAQPGKPYSNSQLASIHYGMFRKAYLTARIEAKRANVYGAQSWGFPQTFRSRKY